MPVDLLFHLEPVDGTALSKTMLSVNEKRHLGRLLATKEHTSAELANRYKLNRRTLIDYKNQYLRFLHTCEHGGRPKLLDEDAIRELMNVVQENPDIPEAHLRHLIRQKARITWQKWNLLDSNRKYKNISIQSVVRYSILLRRGAVRGDF